MLKPSAQLVDVRRFILLAFLPLAIRESLTGEALARNMTSRVRTQILTRVSADSSRHHFRSPPDFVS